MISHTALILAIVGSIWTTLIIGQILVRKKKASANNGSLKKMFRSLVPFRSRSYSKESIEYSFIHTLKTLESLISEKDYAYAQPWFLVIGPSDSGKTTFLNSIKLEKSIDSESFCSENSPCYFHFFNSGIFLDIKGSLVKKDGSVPVSDESMWDKLLTVINRSRPQKPLDGIVMCISVRDLVGANAKSTAELIQDSEYLYKKLWQLQKSTQMKLPVYLVFTHLDEFPEFKDFINEIPQKYLEDIFGWSSPYSLDNSFNETWIDSMFVDMENRIEEIQNEIFVNKDSSENGKVMKFFHEFFDLADPMKVYLSHLFQSNRYSEGYYLRGIYFTGADLANAQEAKAQKEIWPTLPWKKRAVSKAEPEVSQVFVSDLVNQKIFIEKNLGKFISGSSAASATYIKLIQSMLLIFGVSGSIYLANTYRKLESSMSILNPHVEKIVQMMEERKKISSQIDDETFIQEAQILLSAIVNIVQTNLKFAFIPSSWISNLQYKLFSLLENSNDLIIVKALAKKIEEKYIALANFEMGDITAEQTDLKNPLEHDAFRRLHEFVMKFIELEIIQNKFISATENGNVESFAWLIKKLIGVELPQKFYTETKFFSNSLKSNAIEIPNVVAHRQAIKTRVDQLFENFIHNAFKLRNFVSDFSELNRTLFALETKSNNISIENLRTLQSEIANVITFANGPDFAWVQHDGFKMSFFLELMHHVENSTILGASFANSIKKQVNQKFLELKDNLCTMKIAVVGNVFYLDSSRMLKVSDSVIELQGLMNTVFAEPFMQSFDDAKLISDEDYGKSILWNIDNLNEIADIFASYEVFISKRLPKYPSHLIGVLRNATKDNLDKLVRSKLANAKQTLASEFTSANVMTITENIKNSFAPISLILSKCKQMNLSSFNALKDIEKQRNFAILKETNEMLDAENLYQLECSEIFVDNISKSVSYFGRSMSEYLSNQKMRIIHFAKDVIEPVVKTLTMIDTFDSCTIDDDVRRWVSILNDVNAYTNDPKSSNLYKLEGFIKDLEILKIENLNKLMNESTSLNFNTNNFFEAKLVSLKQQMISKMSVFFKKTINDNYDKAVQFIRSNIRFFPFDYSGQVASTDVYLQLDQLLQSQSSQLEMLKQIDPKLKTNNMKFIEALDKVNRLMWYINKPGSVLTLSIQNSNDLSESLEKNLDYLISASATVGATSVIFPDAGALKVTDRIEFKFKLAAQTGIVFMSMQEYIGSGTEIKFVLSKKDLVRMLLKNTVTKNGQTVLKFELPIMDALGKKKVLIFAVPIEINIDNLPLILSDEKFDSYIKAVK